MATIAAIATPPGEGGIGIVRISGPDSANILNEIFVPSSPKFSGFQPWKLHRGIILDWHKEQLDNVLAVFMPGPNTFTGEDVAEIHCHGGKLILECVLESIMRLGVRHAQRGEFTKRAFINGRIDLSQAEAVAELISAPSREALRYGLKRLEGYLGEKIRQFKAEIDDLRAMAYIGVDFPDDEINGVTQEDIARRASVLCADIRQLLKGSSRANAMQSGITVLLAGAVNVGKSSLLNAMLGSERALVTEYPGTTRDFLEENLMLEGLPVRLIDSAGLRDLNKDCADPVEQMGIDRSWGWVKKAEMILVVVDSNLDDLEKGPDNAIKEILEESLQKPVILVFNKSDMKPVAELPSAWPDLPWCSVSAQTGENLNHLAGLIPDIYFKKGGTAPDNELAPNKRQALLLEEALKNLLELVEAASSETWDCCLGRLDTVASLLEDLLGLSSHDELLDNIFSRFCIGK